MALGNNVCMHLRPRATTENNCHFRTEAVHTEFMDYEGSNCRGMGGVDRLQIKPKNTDQPYHALQFRYSPKGEVFLKMKEYITNRPRIPTGMIPVGVSRAPEPPSDSRGRDCGTYRPMRFIDYYADSLSGASSSRLLLVPIDTIHLKTLADVALTDVPEPSRSFPIIVL